MARIRSLKPEMRHDRKLARTPRPTRWHFACLITLADDEGLFRAEPRYLLGECYPHDRDVTESQVDRMTAELLEQGIIRLHQTPDGLVGELVNWKKHQRIHNPSHSGLRDDVRAGRRAEPAAQVEAPMLFPSSPPDAVEKPPKSSEDVRQGDDDRSRMMDDGGRSKDDDTAVASEEIGGALAVAAPPTYQRRCTIAANAGLHANALIGDVFNELVASVQTAALDWERDKIPVELAERVIGERARAYRPEGRNRQPRNLRYFDAAVRDAAEREGSRGAEPPGGTHPFQVATPESLEPVT